MTENARCLQARYDNGISNKKATRSGVAVQIINKDYKHQHEAVYNVSGGGSTLMARDYKGPQRVAIPVLTPDRAEKRQNGRRFKENGEVMFTLTSQDRHGVAVGIGETLQNVADNNNSDIEQNNDSITETVTVAELMELAENSYRRGIFVKISDELTVYAVWYEKEQCYIAVRKLTPKECFRLQGWTDDYFEKAKFVNSDSQLYKQAGNGVTVPVIKAIAERMECDG